MSHVARFTRCVPLLILPLLLLPNPHVLEAGQQGVVINEILYHPDPDNMGGEFIELLNCGEGSVDISGWTLAEAVQFRFPDGTVLDPGAFVVVARRPEDARSFYGVDSVAGPYDGRLNNAGETIVLRDADEREVDSVPYDDEPPWPTEADGGGPSIELIDPLSDNSRPESWGLGQSASPGAANMPADPGDGEIVITEIMYKPLRTETREKFDRVNKGTYVEEGDDEFGEFVELCNRSDAAVDLSGWVFSEGIEFEFPAGTTLQPGGYLVVAADPEILRQRHGITNVVGPFSLSLRNGGERITLRDENNHLVDTVRFNDKYPWPTAPDEFGISLECITPDEDNSTAANWRSSEEALPPIEPILAEVDEANEGWQLVDFVASIRSTRMVFALGGPGEWLIDEVAVRSLDGENDFIANGSFDENDDGWSKSGNHGDSFWTNEGAREGAGAEHIVATAGGRAGGVSVTVRGILSPGPHRVTLWAKHLSGDQTLKVSFLNLDIEEVVTAEFVEYSLSGDWSDEENPSGAWEYQDGDGRAIADLSESWMAADLGAGQRAWASGDTATPGWCRSHGGAPAHDFPAGRIGTHGPAQVMWTSPGLGQVTISGGVSLLRHAGRDQSWEIRHNDEVLTAGELLSGDTHIDSASPSSFETGSGGTAALTRTVAPDDTITLVLRGQPDNGSDFVGVDLNLGFLSGRPAEPPLGGAVGLATPGRENSVSSDRLPPFVESLQHLPDQPTSRDEVTVTARVTSASEIKSVEFGLEILRGDTRQTVDPLLPMFDDGAHNDGAAGDGVYGAQVEAQRSQTLVHYWVRAEDADGRVTLFPYEGEPSPAQAYFHFNGEIRSRLTQFHLFMTPGNLSRLSSNPRSDDYLDCSLVIDDRREGKEEGPVVYPHIGARRRGRQSRLNSQHQWKFKFNRAKLYDGNRVLDTMLNIPLVQRMGFLAFDAAGIENLESDVIRLNLNGRFWDMYIAFEVPNSTWASKHGYGGGTEAYKARSVETPGEAKNSDLYRNQLISDHDFWGAWNKKMRSLEPPDHIRELTDMLNDAPDSELLPWLDANVDMDQVLTRYGINILFNIDDFAGHNFYLFRPEGGKWKMLGYDYDSLGRGATLPINYTDGTTGSPAWQRNKLFERVNRIRTLQRIHLLNMRRLLNEYAIARVLTPVFNAEMARARGENGLRADAASHALSQLASQRTNMQRALGRGRLPGAEDVPTIDPPGGVFGSPVSVTLSAPEGRRAVYTLDDSDPRLSATAMLYTDPIAIAETTTLRTASIRQRQDPPDFRTGDWSDLAEATYELVLDGSIFVRGDFSLDGKTNTTDVVQLLLHLFRGAPVRCRIAGDANDDDALNISDAIFLVDYLYGRGDAPAAPFPRPGVDPGGVGVLGCDEGL